jgi:hypothetical protein
MRRLLEISETISVVSVLIGLSFEYAFDLVKHLL